MEKVKSVFIKIIQMLLCVLLYVVYINGFYFLMSKIDGISEQQLINILSYINTVDNYLFIFGLVLLMNFLIWIYNNLSRRSEEKLIMSEDDQC